MDRDRALDASLLDRPLPPIRQVAVDSDLYATGHGLIEYREAGSTEAPVVVLLHGIGSSSAGYLGQLAGLSDRFRVIAWNAPGYGLSTPLAATRPDVDHYARALALLADELRLDSFTLVGSSWGSVIATVFAERHPARVGALLLASPNVARGAMQGEERAASLAALVASGDGSRPVDRAAVADRLVAPFARPQVRSLVERLRDAVTPLGWSQAAHMLFSVHVPVHVARVTCPVTLVVGEQDEAAPLELHARKLHAAAPSAALEIFESCGHMPKLEAPSRFNDVVRRLSKTASPRTR